MAPSSRSTPVTFRTIAPFELLAVFVDDDPHVQSATQQLLFGFAELGHGLLEPFHGGTPTELHEDVVARLGDHERLPDGTAPLGHHRHHVDAHGHEHPDGALGADVAVDDQTVAARTLGRRRQATENLEFRRVLVEAGEEGVRGEAERIGDHQQRSGGRRRFGPSGDGGAVGGADSLEGQRSQRRPGE